MYIDFEAMSANRRYFAMTQSVLPRPIAWVLSDNGDGGYNLAPFSYFNAICSDPPLLMLSVGQKPTGEKKDTIVNIAERKKCVIHIPHWQQAELVTETSRTLDHGDSELNAELIRAGLSLTEFTDFELPRIAQCRIVYACELYQMQEIGMAPQTLIFAEVKSLFLDDSIATVDSGERLTINALALDPLSRLGGSEYGRLGETKEVPRPR